MNEVGGDDETQLTDESDRVALERLKPSKPPLPRRIGAYEVLAELGRGGMGVVYRARDEALGREVAIKVLLAHGSTPETRRRLEVEARAAARLRHPNIVAVHAYGVDESTGDPFVVMEMVRGRTLRDALRGGPLDPREAARIAEDLARALAAAHEQGVLHRDVKPHNVLLSSTGSPLLADFGLAKAVDSTDGPTSTGQVLGTPAYMSPEQADGDGARVGPLSDVWSLGATLYELLTGRPPFSAATVMLTIAAVLKKDPAPPRSLRAGLDRDLETICLACLEKDPARRYASAGALADDLERWRRGVPIAARPVSGAERVWRAIARRPARAAVALLVASLVVAAGVGTWWAGREARALDTLAEARALARRGRAGADVLARVDRALDEGGRTSALLIEAALTCEAGGLAERAKELLDEAAREHPPGDEALLELHRLTVADGRGSRITPALERLIAGADARGEDDEFAAFARAERAMARGDVRQALAHFDRIEALGGRFPWAFVDRAEAHHELGDLAAARRALDRALELDPELAAAWTSRGALKDELGDLAGARADLDRAVALDPLLATAWYLRGMLRRRAGDGAGAQGDLTRALELSPDHVRANLAHLALGEGRLAQARGQAHGQDGPALQAAVMHLDRALELDPGLALAWALRADALAARGDAKGALRDYARALELDPERKETWYERAILHLELLDPARALADLGRALSLEPGWADAYVRRALVRVSDGDVDGARVDVESALQLEPRLGDGRGGGDVAREELRAVLASLEHGR